MLNFCQKNKFNKGFTLIELLVVIAIIGLLSSVVLASLSSARIKSRDARRKSDLKQIQTALELYYDKYGTYKVKNAGYWGGSSGNYIDNSGGDGYFNYEVTGGTGAYQRSVARALYEEGFSQNIIVDPSGQKGIPNDKPYYMLYYSADGQKYGIYAKMEGDINEDVSYCTSAPTWSFVSNSPFSRNYCLRN